MTEESGVPLDVGRKTRQVPWALRRALKARDGGCRYPGCENKRFLDAHHIQHWADGGETKIDNLILLCRRHHRTLHEDEYRIDEQGRFFHRHGWEILAVPEPVPGCIDALRALSEDVDIRPTTVAGGCDEPIDLEMAVDGLITCIDGASRLWPNGSGLPAGLDVRSQGLFVELLGRVNVTDEVADWQSLFVLPERYRPGFTTHCAARWLDFRGVQFAAAF